MTTSPNPHRRNRMYIQFAAYDYSYLLPVEGAPFEDFKLSPKTGNRSARFHERISWEIFECGKMWMT